MCQLGARIHVLKNNMSTVGIWKYLPPVKKFVVTFVVKKRTGSKISSIACAKLDTVAIRFPKHKIVKSLLKNINFPLAMPSANISSNVSPTKATDV